VALHALRRPLAGAEPAGALELRDAVVEDRELAEELWGGGKGHRGLPFGSGEAASYDAESTTARPAYRDPRYATRRERRGRRGCRLTCAGGGRAPR
jgi:hypothetical protein